MFFEEYKNWFDFNSFEKKDTEFLNNIEGLLVKKKFRSSLK